PVWATPTKPNRTAAGLDLLRSTAEAAPTRPWFAIGGIDASNVDEVLAAGADRIVVVRAITQARDPQAAARELAEILRLRR
ncbi:MAG: thiamine phosphate synthase, partial [Rhodococcus sp. (in: high G+C Gram-positive bacteria)]